MKSAGKARSNGLYRHIRTSKEIIRNLLNDYKNILKFFSYKIFLCKISIYLYNKYDEKAIYHKKYGKINILGTIRRKNL